MSYRISHPTKKLIGSIELTASKSESNRALIIQALCADKFEIKNLAAAEDTRVLKEILDSAIKNPKSEVVYDVGAAGTTMRFLTAYFSTVSGTHILTGSERMKNRPIAILVNALRELGADIHYMEKEGFPPLKIKGKELQGGAIEIDGSMSSQYISALLLISPKLQNGLTLKFKGKVTSLPYIILTYFIMELFGVSNKRDWRNNIISIKHQTYYPTPLLNRVYEVEGDWSSASYWYGFAALAKEVDFTIKGLKKFSVQGDAIVVAIFKELGILTNFIDGGIHLTKDSNFSIESIRKKGFNGNFNECPDLAQTVAVVVSALQIPSTFTGLHTLRIKETDRTAALKNELAKLGTEIEIVSDDEIKINPKTIVPNPDSIATYEDHRMAMAFSTWAMLHDSIIIEHPEVVKKSYPDFWNDMKKAGFKIEEI